MLAVLIIAAAFTSERMTAPEPAGAVPIAIGGAEGGGLIASGLLAAGSVAAGSELGHIINRAGDRAHAIVRHPRVYERYMKRVRGYRDFGGRIWKRAGKSIRGLRRFMRRHIGTVRIRRHWPSGVWSCVVAGTTSYLANRKLRDAAFACLGAFVAGVTVPPRGTRTVAIDDAVPPPWVVRIEPAS
jgi:hypothetical protein